MSGSVRCLSVALVSLAVWRVRSSLTGVWTTTYQGHGAAVEERVRAIVHRWRRVLGF